MTGSRANFWVGVPLLLFFFVGGILFWSVLPDIYIGQIWVGVSLLLALIFGGLALQQRNEQRVIAAGIKGTAQILGMTQTGVQVNEQPQVELHMRIEAPGIRPYELKKKFVVPLIALGQLSGGRLNVAIDREDQENAVIDWGAPAAGADAMPTAAPMTISTQNGRTFDLSADPELKKQVFTVLGKHGLAMSGELDLRQHPHARAEVLALLAAEGHAVDPSTPGPAPAAPPAASAQAEPEKATPAERLEQLRQLKEKGLVSKAEYESKRIQIISEF